MPERGQVLRLADRGPLVDPRTGEVTEDDSPIWTPYIAGSMKLSLPPDLRGAGPAVQSLPMVGAVGPDYVYDYYGYLESRRVETSAKSYVLSDSDTYGDIAAQTGGVPRLALTVLRVIGDLRTTQDGVVYDAERCFRFRLDVGPDGRPDIMVHVAIGWLVHHVDQRAPRLDVDWETGARVPGTANAHVPLMDVRLDLAERSGINVYAPREVAGIWDSSRAPSPTSTPAAPTPGAVNVLPSEQPGRRGLFGRKR